MNFEALPEYLIQKILEFFQTSKLLMFPEGITDYQKQQMLFKSRKNLINGKGIKTDLPSIMTFSMINKKFNHMIKKSDIGNLLMTIHYNSEELSVSDKLEHISYCHIDNCRNVCHYVNKDIKHSDIIKRMAIRMFNEQKDKNNKEKKNKEKKDQLVEKFRPYVFSGKKQPFKIRTALNETSKFSESTE